eukprot:1137503-Pelagomonas_calceolata.AAC.5
MAPKGAEGSAVATADQLTEDQIAEFKEVGRGRHGTVCLIHGVRGTRMETQEVSLPRQTCRVKSVAR